MANPLSGGAVRFTGLIQTATMMMTGTRIWKNGYMLLLRKLKEENCQCLRLLPDVVRHDHRRYAGRWVATSSVPEENTHRTACHPMSKFK